MKWATTISLLFFVISKRDLNSKSLYPSYQMYQRNQCLVWKLNLSFFLGPKLLRIWNEFWRKLQPFYFNSKWPLGGTRTRDPSGSSSARNGIIRGTRFHSSELPCPCRARKECQASFQPNIASHSIIWIILGSENLTSSLLPTKDSVKVGQFFSLCI